MSVSGVSASEIDISSSSSKKLSKTEAEQLMLDVSEFFVQQQVTDQVLGFLRRTHKLYDQNMSSHEEHKLEYTDYFHEFCGMYEQRIEEFLQHRGVSNTQFYALVKEEMQHRAKDGVGVLDFLVAILSLFEYQTFDSTVRDLNKIEYLSFVLSSWRSTMRNNTSLEEKHK